MEFIVGGKAQGKRDYMIKKYNVEEDIICDGKSCTPQELEEAAFIDELHEFIRRFPQWEPVFRQDAVIICDEVGSGIVPVDEEDRRWRESVGRIGCRIAAEADTVTRLVFGIPVALK